jgi:glutamyl-tRNA synthetase
VPLIHGADGAKLSKRHGALGIEAYRDMGYLPEAMRNYLARLGWSHGNDEFFTTEQAIAWFDLSHLGKAPARFDLGKLEALSGQHIRAAADDEVLAEVEGFLAVQKRSPLTPLQRARMLRGMQGLKERARTIPQILDMAHYILGERPFVPDDAAAKVLASVSHGMLERLTSRLQNATWSPGELETAVRDFAGTEGLGLGKVAQPLRIALTGRTVSPGVFDMMDVLGREESLARLADCAKTRQTGT